MRAHTQEFKEQIKELGKEIDSRITYGNTIITSEKLYSVSPITNGSILKSCMKELDFESSVQVPQYAVIKYEFGLKVNGEYEYIDFGNYIVYSSEYNEDTQTYEHTCYDSMLFSMKEYTTLQNGSFPMTIREYITNLCLDIGLVFKDSINTFANYDKILKSDVYANLGYTYRDIFDELSQVTASTICVDNNNLVEIRYLNETNDTIDEEYLKDINVKFGQKYGPINSIVLSRSGQSDNVYRQDPISVGTNGLCEIKIIDNQIMNFNDRSDYLPDILEKLSGLEYYTNDFLSTGILYYEICDKYNIKIGNNIYSCVLFNDEQKITQGLVENIYTEMPEETETDYTKADKTDRKINQTYIIVDKQNKKIESVASETDKQSQKIAQVTQTVNEIKSEISEVADITISADGYGNVSLANINKSEPIYLKIYPTNGQDISYLYPRDNLYPSDDLFPQGRTLRFTNGDYAVDYELPNDLLYYDEENYDEFILDYDAQSCVVNKKVGYNADGSKYLLEIPQTIEYEYPIIDLEAGDYTIEMLNYSNAFLFARLMVQNIYTDQFATKMEMNSAITQTAESIKSEVSKTYATQNQGSSSINQMASSITSNVSSTYATKGELTKTQTTINQTTDNISSEVSKKVGSNEIISKINQSVEAITILADKLGLTANDILNIIAGNVINLTSKNIVIKSNHFSVDKNGKLECSDATITGGKLNISDSTGGNIITLNDTKNNNTISMSGSTIRFKDNDDSTSNSFVDSTGAVFSTDNYSATYGHEMVYLREGSSYTLITASDGLSHSSKEEYKKNIKKLENNLNLIKDCDVYSYLFKEEKEGSRLHRGLVIGKGYNTPDEVLNKAKDGIDIFNMCAIMWGSIKEQQEIIEELKQQIKSLKGE